MQGDIIDAIFEACDNNNGFIKCEYIVANSFELELIDMFANYDRMGRYFLVLSIPCQECNGSGKPVQDDGKCYCIWCDGTGYRFKHNR